MMMMMSRLALPCLLLFSLLLCHVVSSTEETSFDYPGSFGLDISVAISKTISQSQWRCLREQGNYSFAIIEGWQGGYGRNSFLADAVARAWAGGMDHVDVYAFMCPRCSNYPSSVQNLVNYLRDNNVKFGMIWMDIEQCNGCWNADLASNCAWVRSLANTYTSMGIQLGIYSSPGEWPMTVGAGCRLNEFPLWYAHYDGNPSFSDWPSNRFGGWDKPSIKQFADSAGNSCGISIDRNWYP